MENDRPVGGALMEDGELDAIGVAGGLALNRGVRRATKKGTIRNKRKKTGQPSSLVENRR
jgi:hypothetical protein